jgi:glutamate formiminotransferase/glutamate formiminotransferase/formiminotetrahydrofolate cyclodeaminase
LLVECVPNVSEGRDLARVAALESAIAAVPGVHILHRTSDADHNRSVFTFAGEAEAVLEAAVRLTAGAAELIDLNQHRGVHPRLGALDVLPFVPLGETVLSDCAALAHRAGERIWRELHIPVYFYQAAALRPERTLLEKVRQGEFEGLRESVQVDVTKCPDIGGPKLHPTAGAVIVGARPILIAYNINLETTDLSVAKNIARAIRTSSGGLPCVKALGLPLALRGQVQVSMNLTDFNVTPPHVAFAEVSRLAAAAGVLVAESELIGLVPRKAVEMGFADALRLRAFSSDSIIENCLPNDTFRETFNSPPQSKSQHELPERITKLQTDRS